MGKFSTCFQTDWTQKPYLLGWHIPICLIQGSTPPGSRNRLCILILKHAARRIIELSIWQTLISQGELSNYKLDLRWRSPCTKDLVAVESLFLSKHTDYAMSGAHQIWWAPGNVYKVVLIKVVFWQERMKGWRALFLQNDGNFKF